MGWGNGEGRGEGDLELSAGGVGGDLHNLSAEKDEGDIKNLPIRVLSDKLTQSIISMC